jgi:hypothetical protein
MGMKSKRWLVYVYLVLTAVLTIGLMAFGGCGGGGGVDYEDGGHYLPITHDTLIQYNGTEVLEYAAYVRTKDNDGGSTNEYYGETDYVSLGWQNLNRDNLMKIMTVSEHSYPSHFWNTESRYFYHDINDNIYLYSYETSGSFYPANPVDNDTGIRYMPHRITIGSSWGGAHGFLDGGDYYVGNINFTVLGKEEIGVPFGAVETFKIAISGEYESQVDGSTYKITAYGTIWIHPDIGVIREYKTQEINRPGWFYTVRRERQLTTINWALN